MEAVNREARSCARFSFQTSGVGPFTKLLSVSGLWYPRGSRLSRFGRWWRVLWPLSLAVFQLVVYAVYSFQLLGEALPRVVMNGVFFGMYYIALVLFHLKAGDLFSMPSNGLGTIVQFAYPKSALTSIGEEHIDLPKIQRFFKLSTIALAVADFLLFLMITGTAGIAFSSNTVDLPPESLVALNIALLFAAIGILILQGITLGAFTVVVLLCRRAACTYQDDMRRHLQLALGETEEGLQRAAQNAIARHSLLMDEIQRLSSHFQLPVAFMTLFLLGYLAVFGATFLLSFLSPDPDAAANRLILGGEIAFALLLLTCILVAPALVTASCSDIVAVTAVQRGKIATMLPRPNQRTSQALDSLQLYIARRSCGWSAYGISLRMDQVRACAIGLVGLLGALGRMLSQAQTL